MFRPRACAPELNFPFSEQLILTIDSRAASADAQPVREAAAQREKQHLRTISDVFAALRGCWVPPAQAQAKPGMQVAVRLSFKRGGEIFGQPRITYITPGSSRELRQTYFDAIMAALHRCTPLGFSKGLGNALAGRPFAIRFVDDRGPS